ncbi:MAG: FAD:protein FMN transferase [Gammaproteobacteria bacterium]
MVAFAFWLTLAVQASPGARAEWVAGEAAIMGTAIRVELWEPAPGTGADLIELVMEEMRRIDRRMSTYRDDSLLSRVNREAAQTPVQLDDELYELITHALSFSDLTHGAFDITYGSVGRLYDFRAGVQPDDAAREQALQAVGYGNVQLDQKTRTIRFDREGVNINLGGVAKGYAVEKGVKILRRRGVTSAIVTAGGDSRILGDRRGRPWTVGIRDPRDRRGLVTRIPLQDEAISTSGDYERFFESDGERVHHIIKPDTGKSASEVRSVTIIGGDATVTDALSTGVFVLGRERGLALIETLNDFEAVVIDQSGRMHYSSGLTPGG